MWDWELLKNGSSRHSYEIVGQYRHEDFQYTHAISHGTDQDEYCLHNHAMYELVYCLSGDAVYMAEGVRYKLEADGLLIISPAVPHKLFICSDKPFERHILYIYYIGKSNALSGLITSCQRPMGDKRMGSAYYGPEAVRGLRHLLTDMSNACRSGEEDVRALVPCFAQALLSEMLMDIREKTPRLFSVGSCKTSDALLSYISQNFAGDISLQTIADRFFLSKDYCNRLFRKTTGMTVMQYVLHSRVLYAKQLLADGVAASEVAKRVGFTDYSSFYRVYKKITGRIPRDDYRIAEDILETPAPNPVQA